MKITHNGKRIDRDIRGRFAPGFIKMGTVIFFAVLVGLIIAAYFTGAAAAEPVMFQKAEAEFAEKQSQKYSELQQGVLDTLSGCETQGVKEQDATILLDTNNKMSIGRYQFQITTVQHYYKKLYSKDISRTEAIAISIDKEKSTELARDIIFDVQGGIYNWKNCARKHDLVDKVAIIKTLK